MALADLDGDARLDLIATAANGGTSVLLGKGDGTFEAPVSYGPGADGLAIADLDGDGLLDVALATGDVLRGLGSGALAAATIGAATTVRPGSSPKTSTATAGWTWPTAPGSSRSGAPVDLSPCRRRSPRARRSTWAT